ncbi:hypothetical protein ES319_D07G103100v1 [Gossypium barbadense]|uniref:Uncharacterized protein n=2 Tax=Gossypium TaxID=3633 RepID=A0A5J5QPI3_GOSBA|nr:hypothetical protein ES319_D07G103100v1 [Gossypium barbadense]TYG60939.1 hypothetical protein ES288_D07G108100v1 [Gossypium darwinii]
MPTARLCWYGHRAKLPDVGETTWAVAMRSCVREDGCCNVGARVTPIRCLLPKVSAVHFFVF